MIDDAERDDLTAADFAAAGVTAPNWKNEPIPSLETWRAWKAAEDQAMAHKRATARANGAKLPV